MTLREGYQVLGAITSILSFISVFGAGYIMHSAVQLRRRSNVSAKNRESRALFITDLVFWMAFCDVIQQAWLGWTWLSVAFDSSFNANWPNYICKPVGFVAQFFLLGSASWNFIIAILLLRILLGFDVTTHFDKELRYYHYFAWYVLSIHFTICDYYCLSFLTV